VILPNQSTSAGYHPRMLRLLLFVLCIYETRSLSNQFLLQFNDIRYAFKKKTNSNLIFYLRLLPNVVVIFRFLAVAFLKKNSIVVFVFKVCDVCKGQCMFNSFSCPLFLLERSRGQQL